MLWSVGLLLFFFNIQETNLEIPVEVKKPRRGRPPKTSAEGEKNRPQDVTEATQSAREKPSGAAVTEAAAGKNQTQSASMFTDDGGMVALLWRWLVLICVFCDVPAL